MKLPQVLDAIEGPYEAFKEAYIKGDDGKYHLDAEGLSEMQTALKTANKEAAERRVALEKLKGIDPEEYQRLKTKADEDAQKQAESKGEWEKLKEQMAQKTKAELEAKDGVIAKYRSQLERTVIDAQAIAAIAAAKGVPELLLHHVKSRVKVSEEGGDFKFQILDDKGNPMIADAAGNPAGFSHLVESMKANPIFGRAFEGVNASGSNTPSATATPGATPNPKSSPSERLKAHYAAAETK